jgi:hypothetical protein
VTPITMKNHALSMWTNVLANYPILKTVATEAFGGRMKLLGKKIFDNFDREKIRLWAEKLPF